MFFYGGGSLWARCHRKFPNVGESMHVKRFTMAALAALALAACGDAESSNPMASAERGPEQGPSLATAPVGARWSLYTSQTPTETLDATGGWEVGTRFTSSKKGKVIGFRFYRASGETGTNTARLWTDGGQQLASANFPSGGAGWKEVYLSASAAAAINANTYYRVSVNTNTAQVKTNGGYAFYGALSNGPLYSSGSHYGQPTGSMPNTSSASYFFVDVIFEEYVPLPDLYISGVWAFGGTDYWGNEVIEVHVCNRGDGVAAGSTLRVHHRVAPYSGGSYWKPSSDWGTPSVNPGTCTKLFPYVNSVSQATNDYQVMTDVTDVVYESNEGNNWGRGLYGKN
jgi:hypothetical protein